MVAPYTNTDEFGIGIHIQGEYVFDFNKWLGFRPYVGMLFSKPFQTENELNHNVSINAFFGGGKARVTLPVQWFAPYVEMGYGFSLGKIKNYNSVFRTEKNGFFWHIPYSIGIELGKERNVSVGFSYFIINDSDLAGGGLDISLTIPLNKSILSTK